MDEVKVTQSIRDAAADWCKSQPFPSKQVEAVSIRAGEYDHHSLVQAFARFDAQSREDGARAMQDNAMQRCRYVAKHNHDRQEEGLYRDGFEIACEVCEDRIADLDPAKVVAGRLAALSPDVRELVITAREFWEEHGASGDPLDKALEPFSSRVPYANQPD